MPPLIVIVGVGALGSHLLLGIRNIDVRITLVDFDRVELKNTMSQFHVKQGVGLNKVQALQKTMRMLFGASINGAPVRLSSENLDMLLGGARGHPADLVVDCTDNGEARQLMQAWCTTHDIPLLHGSLAADGAYARVMWTEHFSIDDDGEGGATCEDGEHLPFISWVSAMMAMEVQSFLATGRKRSFHLTPGSVTLIA